VELQEHLDVGEVGAMVVPQRFPWNIICACKHSDTPVHVEDGPSASTRLWVDMWIPIKYVYIVSLFDERLSAGRLGCILEHALVAYPNILLCLMYVCMYVCMYVFMYVCM
jgi:hypothetical protein